jgi:hypothetical protein
MANGGWIRFLSISNRFNWAGVAKNEAHVI